MDPTVLIIIAVIVVLVVVVIGIYNGLVQRRLRIDEAFAQIEVQLKRRHDLIPNLVNAVKGYMGFEQKVLTDVTNARANAVAAGAQGPAQQAAAENALTGTLRSLFAVVENYPELKANQNVLELQEQLTTTENQISFSRQHYNASVLDYNTSIATFPSALIAGLVRLHQARVLRRRARSRQRPERRPQPELDRPPAGGTVAGDRPSTSRSPPTGGTRSCMARGRRRSCSGCSASPSASRSSADPAGGVGDDRWSRSALGGAVGRRHVLRRRQARPDGQRRASRSTRRARRS